MRIEFLMEHFLVKNSSKFSHGIRGGFHKIRNFGKKKGYCKRSRGMRNERFISVAQKSNIH